MNEFKLFICDRFIFVAVDCLHPLIVINYSGCPPAQLSFLTSAFLFQPQVFHLSNYLPECRKVCFEQQVVRDLLAVEIERGSDIIYQHREKACNAHK